MAKADRKTIHLICNAHLDPVWLWEWPEGAAETISTFRTAAEICEDNETFIFNHNEAILYEWIREYDPALFKRIQKLVKLGRWHIMGGWYLQPDCNMISGESFVRQILAGRTYFTKFFGVEPTTAINFDPFGHSRGLVQILAKSGYDSYLFGRPEANDLALPKDSFVWVGFDGSEITATRFPSWYNSPLGKAKENILKKIEANLDKKIFPALWGVGNHGGGPSRRDVKAVNRLICQTNDRVIQHSTPEKYFKELVRSGEPLPRFEHSLNPWGVGCYTSMIRIKQSHRRLENELYMTEKMCSAAAVAGAMPYPQKEIEESQRDLLFGQFHDILPGSAIQSVEQAAMDVFAHGLEILSRVKTRAFFALAAGQKRAKEGNIPILVYNPHPFDVHQPVECEFNLPDVCPATTYYGLTVRRGGISQQSQVEQELSNLTVEWRKHVVFDAVLKPGMNRFDCIPTLAKRPKPLLRCKGDHIKFKTTKLEILISCRSGLLDRYRVNGIDYVGKNAFLPTVMLDETDSWGMKIKKFDHLEGRFRLMSKGDGTKFSGFDYGKLDSVRVIEDGDVRSVVEAVFSYKASFICQRYKLPKNGTEIEIETIVHWNQKNRMLKLSIPLCESPDYNYLGQTAYGVNGLSTDGSEVVAQKWVAAVSKKKNAAVTCINDGIYGSDFSKSCLRLSLLRSPAYAAERIVEGTPRAAHDRFIAHQDQGERIFRFWFNAGKVSERLESIDRQALVKNERPFALSFYPNGGGKAAKPFAVLSDRTVQVGAIKKAVNEDAYIVRIFEPTGKARETVLALAAIGKKIKIRLNKFEIKTLKINSKTGKYREVNLLER